VDKKILLGKRLKELRKRREITQEKLAELINVDPTTISNIENGKNYPSLANLENILKILNCTFLEVFDFEHKKDTLNLIQEINKKLNDNPDKIEEIYKIVDALTK